MNAFAHFAAQHAELLNRKRETTRRPDARQGARPDTPTEIAALEYVKAHPGVDARGIARAIEVDAELLYPIMQRLKRNGQIVSTGRVGNGNLWEATPC